MLTPQDIKDTNFTKAVFGGYDMGGVDDFIDKLAEDYEALYKENAILKSKLKVLVEKVEEYRSTEDAMRMALLGAKKMADEMVEEGKKKAEAMLRATEDSLAVKLKAVKKQVDDEERRLKAAQRVTAEFVDMSVSLCKKQVSFLQKLGELKETDIEEQAAPAPVQKPEIVEPAVEEQEDSATRVYASMPEDIKIAESKLSKPKLPEGWEDDDDEPASPRPKFEFRDLKFGNNIDEE
jgi:cell division initiation protein